MTRTKSYFEQYNEFGDACGIYQGKLVDFPNPTAVRLGIKLVHEEWNEETYPVIQKYLANPSLENLAEVADGIVDTVYVLMQLSRALGVPFDKCWEAVHAANMAKVGPDGKVIRREDGKILKPEGWKPPNIWEVLNRHHAAESYEHGKLGAENWTARDFEHKGSAG